jgi:hypothetical protein
VPLQIVHLFEKGLAPGLLPLARVLHIRKNDLTHCCAPLQTQRIRP